MKRHLLVIYDTNDLHALIVVDLEKQLPNGNYKTIKILFANYADDIYKELTEG